MEDTAIDDAVAVLRNQAEAHEAEHGGNYCVGIRATLVTMVALNLGLDLEDMGVVLAEMGEVIYGDCDDPPIDEWANVVDDGKPS